jgi:hypothetical protein
MPTGCWIGFFALTALEHPLLQLASLNQKVDQQKIYE